MKSYKQKVVETVAYLKERIQQLSPKIGILIGTGLGESIKSLNVENSFNYKDIVNFPVSTAPSHAGKLITGDMNGRQIVVMQGRFHIYEGYSPADVVFPIRVMQELGVKTLIISNAAGGLDPQFKQGDIMIIDDHINLTGFNPLIGVNENDWGVRFPDMTCAYDKHLATLAQKAGKNAKIKLQKGVYAGLCGPSLETPAETRFLKTIGASAVGFSTILEVIAAVHGKMKVLGLSIITNINNPDSPVSTTIEEIIDSAESATDKLGIIVQGVVKDYLF